jgi:preprotein translocase subunit SecA
VSLRWQDLAGATEVGDQGDLTREGLLEAVLADVREAYTRREAEIDAIAGEGGMRDLERRVLLSVLDRKWREHLYEMDYLKEGIGLRAMAQRDPLVEYQREGYDMFRGMLEGLKEESVGFLFNVTVEAVPAPAPSVSAASEAQIAAAARQLAAARAASAPAGDGGAAALDEAALDEVAPAAPAAVRAKGLEERSAPALTYSGPDEDGGTAVSRAPAEAADGQPAARRDRRAAARTQAKGSRPSRKK